MVDYLTKTVFVQLNLFLSQTRQIYHLIFLANSDKKIFNYSILQNRIVGWESSDAPTTCIHRKNLFVCVGISIVAHNYVSL